MVSRPDRRFPGWPLLVMVVGLACVGLATLELGRAVRANRLVTERAEAGYARFALWSYREHLAEAMRAAAREVLGAVNHGQALHVSPVVPPAASLGHYLPYVAACDCHTTTFGPMPAVFYGFAVGSDTVGVGPNFHADTTTGWLADPPEGTLLPPGPERFRLPADEARWLGGLLSGAARDGFSEWGYRFVVSPWQGRERFFVATLMPTGWGDTLLYAAEYTREAFDSLLGGVLDHPDLLPSGEGMTTGARIARNHAVLALEVRAPSGASLFASSVPVSWPAPPAVLPASYGGLAIQAAIVPEKVEALVVGGLPKARTPLLLALLAVAAGLTMVAAVQLRREVRFARARADFVASVSHELRTPLTQIRLVLDSIAMAPDGPTATRERGLGLVEREVLRLQHLVDRVLRFRSGEQAPTEVRREPTDLAAEAKEVVAEFAPLAAGRRVALRLEAPAPAPVAAEPGAMRQVLLNLLDNAVKFGPAGQQITIRVVAVDNQVRLEVLDQGPGFSVAERLAVLEPYRRGSAAERSAVGGSGIGLTLVRDLVVGHGGAIALDGEAGGGARVTVTLPRAG